MKTTGFRVNYHGYHSDGGFADVEVFDQPDGRRVIVATDRSDEHQNTSLTNRIERVMFLAWDAIGQPADVMFVEHYDHSPDEYDAATFKDFPATRECRCGGKPVGKEFQTPSWRRLSREEVEALLA